MISVLIPVYNREACLGEAIRSVLAQTERDVEVIVIDDGSTDGTARIARSFPDVKCIVQRHCGVAVARNRGLWEARGELIAFLDSDDRFAPSKLEKQRAYLENHPECAVCCTEISPFTDIPESELTERQKTVMRAEVPFILPSACIRRSVFDRCGCFDTGLAQGEDTEWLSRVCTMLGEKALVRLDEPLYFRRIHADNLSLASEVPFAAARGRILGRSRMHVAMLNDGWKVSVIIPACNAEKYLDEAVQSVFRQNWVGGLELILVDNGSTDRTPELALQYNCIRLQEPRKGAAFARNRGLAAATGDFIVFLDADDVLADGAADNLFRPLYRAQKPDAVFGRTVDFISPELTSEEMAELRPRQGAYPGILPGCSLIRKTVFDRIGLFDTALSSGETVDWMMRLKDSGIAAGATDAVILHRRLHLTNTGRIGMQEERKNYAALLRRRMMNREREK